MPNTQQTLSKNSFNKNLVILSSIGFVIFFIWSALNAAISMSLYNDLFYALMIGFFLSMSTGIAALPVVGLVIGILNLNGSKKSTMIGGITLIILGFLDVIFSLFTPFKGLDGTMTVATLPFGVLNIILGLVMTLHKPKK